MRTSLGGPSTFSRRRAEYKKLLKESGLKLKLEPIMKWDFYAAVESPDHVLTIQTADQALWANVLLSVGVRTPGK